MKIIDLTGQRFGRLYVIKENGRSNSCFKSKVNWWYPKKLKTKFDDEGRKEN